MTRILDISTKSDTGRTPFFLLGFYQCKDAYTSAELAIMQAGINTDRHDGRDTALFLQSIIRYNISQRSYTSVRLPSRLSSA